MDCDMLGILPVKIKDNELLDCALRHGGRIEKKEAGIERSS